MGGEEGGHGSFATRQSAAFCGPLKSAGKRFLCSASKHLEANKSVLLRYFSR